VFCKHESLFFSFRTSYLPDSSGEDLVRRSLPFTGMTTPKWLNLVLSRFREPLLRAGLELVGHTAK
jgi:hypothetical protein